MFFSSLTGSDRSQFNSVPFPFIRYIPCLGTSPVSDNAPDRTASTINALKQILIYACMFPGLLKMLYTHSRDRISDFHLNKYLPFNIVGIHRMAYNR